MCAAEANKLLPKLDIVVESDEFLLILDEMKCLCAAEAEELPPVGQHPQA